VRQVNKCSPAIELSITSDNHEPVRSACPAGGSIPRDGEQIGQDTGDLEADVVGAAHGVSSA
jgi:hypothetical protein